MRNSAWHHGTEAVSKRALFYRPWFFWAGTAAVFVGVIFSLPMFMQLAKIHYSVAGVPMRMMMWIGMFLNMAGVAATAYGLLPNKTGVPKNSAEDITNLICSMDDAPLSITHWKLLSVLLMALIIDAMKPATIGFVLPGMIFEYGITRQDAAILPFFALTGTVLGSVWWGILGDRIGRRATILLAGVLFCSTCVCGAMPAFFWNVIMCFLMGIAAGGMLPISFALLAETVPKKHRAWVAVLIGGVATVGGYAVVSSCAAFLEPYFGWRIMWLLGLPTGLLLIALNRYIPESPRFLANVGRLGESMLILRRFGVTLSPDRTGRKSDTSLGTTKADAKQLFCLPYLPITVGLALYGLGWGLVNFGFLLWLPVRLRANGYGVAASNLMLAESALAALPAVIVSAWSCFAWGVRKSMILSGALTAAALAAFALRGSHIAAYPKLLMAMLAVVFMTSSAMIAIVVPYSAEVFPSLLRGTGTGLAAGSAKAGGVVAVTIAMVWAVPTQSVAAALGAVPIIMAAWWLYRHAIDTDGARLEDLEKTLRDASNE